MQVFFKAVVLMGVVAVANGAVECGNGGVLKGDCCECHQGYTKADDGSCTQCAKGYEPDGNGLCVNGQRGSECRTERQWPHQGCTDGSVKMGECSQTPEGRSVFPCVCRDMEGKPVDCGEKKLQAAKNAECSPAGARMYTTYPNEPSMGEKFSLTIVGCRMTPTDDTTYMVIPAYDQDLNEENSCSRIGNHRPEGNVTDGCQFQYTEDGVQLGADNETSADCPSFLLTHKQQDPAVLGMEEITFKNLLMTSLSSYHAEEIRGQTIGGVYQREQYFKVCRRVREPGSINSNDVDWREVATHNSAYDRRLNKFVIASKEMADLYKDTQDPKGAALDGDANASCCEGLKIGSLCLPLWAFLLLWLLMALCLGALGFMLHKNKNDIEAQKNNEKYEKFHTDNEMQDYAKEQNEDDDI